MRMYDASQHIPKKVDLADINEYIITAPPEEAKEWHATTVGTPFDGTMHYHASRWLRVNNVEFLESFTGVYWIKNKDDAVKFKLIFG